VEEVRSNRLDLPPIECWVTLLISAFLVTTELILFLLSSNWILRRSAILTAFRFGSELGAGMPALLTVHLERVPYPRSGVLVHPFATFHCACTLLLS